MLWYSKEFEDPSENLLYRESMKAATFNEMTNGKGSPLQPLPQNSLLHFQMRNDPVKGDQIFSFGGQK